jgi:hypothetical protein
MNAALYGKALLCVAGYYAGKLLKTAVNVGVAVAKDVCTLGGLFSGQDKSYTAQLLEKIDPDQ